jgi:hypothetical protein
MAKKKHVVCLPDADREHLLDLTRNGRAGDREVTLAHILLMSNDGSTDDHIARTLQIGVKTIRRARERFAAGGTDAVLNGKSQIGHLPTPAENPHDLAEQTAPTDEPGARELPAGGMPAAPCCGIQWAGTVAANAEGEWYTFGWPAGWHVIWTVIPTSISAGAPQLSWQVRVERSAPAFVTYWVTVQNLTDAPVSFVIRYAILSRNE